MSIYETLSMMTWAQMASIVGLFCLIADKTFYWLVDYYNFKIRPHIFRQNQGVIRQNNNFQVCMITAPILIMLLTGVKIWTATQTEIKSLQNNFGFRQLDIDKTFEETQPANMRRTDYEIVKIRHQKYIAFVDQALLNIRRQLEKQAQDKSSPEYKNALKQYIAILYRDQETSRQISDAIISAKIDMIGLQQKSRS